ncbi:hypothetical protein DC498_17920 [Terrimonas sp.]|uniref:hypothetical protein n=1 Tax=Terrimonas sp. TaxID=1914338 RepID=UPI000D5195ED|nr:hypothetical protein [Terrimonas sp.]PVD50844.1 hypothetical protein DC498_17920 [Terrimonas sp.]
MKTFLFITLFSFTFFSCKKENSATDTALHPIEYNESRNIIGEYRGAFSWSKTNSETIQQKAIENQEGTFSIKYIEKNQLEIISNISSDLKYKTYEMRLFKVSQANDHIEYYFTGKAKDYSENINSYAEMSLQTYEGKNIFSFYGCNSFDGISNEALHIFDATLVR